VVILVWLSRRPPLQGVVQPTHLHDLGNLMLAFTMLWAYFSFSQYLIIWAGNLPHEIEWYMHRSYTSWRVVAVALIVFHFALPFILLLSRQVKRHGETLIKVAIGVLAIRVVDLFWLIAPEFHRDGLSVSWLDVLLPVALGCIWFGCFIWQLRGRAILPVHDPQFDETLGPIIERGQRIKPAH
jgi:FtsH-binding integral membrane protein